ncbi:MAG: hypothetical protein WBD31_06840 [Rubripirellula sp.]
MTISKTLHDQYVKDGFDPLGALVMVIDGYPAEDRYEPTVELLESLDYQRVYHDSPKAGEYEIIAPGGSSNPTSLIVFFVKFKIGRFLILYQPINRDFFRGKAMSPHRPESDLRFADWYPVKDFSVADRKEKIEDQLADDFPNAALAAQFLHGQGFRRSNTHKKLDVNTYFVSARQGDGQPSGIVFRGTKKTYFFDFYSDDRYVMGPNGLLMEYKPTQRQFELGASIAVNSLSF